MTGRILVIDDVATNRIVLKVKLSASQYQIDQCDSFTEARQRLDGRLPELIVIDQARSSDEALDFCALVRSSARGNAIPILVLVSGCDNAQKTALLESGVEEVLLKPVSEDLLMARIRSLLRARSVVGELALRDETKQALGLAEAPALFVKPSLVGIVADDAHISRLWSDAMAGKKGLFCTFVERKKLFSPKNAVRVPDVFLIDGTRGDNTAVLRLLSELRSRKETHHSMILLVASDTDPDLAAMALDLGADDLLFDGFSTRELLIRIDSLIRHKQQRDRLRSDLRDGIAAAMIDPLTGLHNRRYAMPALERMMNKAQKDASLLAVMVVDVDHFKTINDSYGHDVGDRVLAEVAARLKANLRPSDMIARIGGEEFLVVLPDINPHRARVAAHRLCETINSRAFSVDDTQRHPVTVSIGLALGGTDETLRSEDLIRKADAALYTSKSSGRNKVSISPAVAA